jgi:ABC-type sugar transport system substrate-binding protein
VVIVDSGIEWDGMVSYVATDNYKGGVLRRSIWARCSAARARR